jgi:hypothetical protein
MGRVMVVSGAFATHTTKLYNYYVCPQSWNIQDLAFIAVNYCGELKYIGKIIGSPLIWDFSQNNQFIFENRNEIPNKIINDLFQFRAILNEGNHYLFLLKPLHNPLCEFLKYQGNGAFVRSHRYFESLEEMLESHQGIADADNTTSNTIEYSANNEGELNQPIN